MTDSPVTKQAVANSFGAAATAYLDSDTHKQGADLKQITEWCEDKARVLDVATGAGHTAGAVSNSGASRVVAVDIAPEMVFTTAEAFPDVDAVVGDAEQLPFGTNQFDIVTCRIAAHHFPNPSTFINEASRVLREGGTFILEDNISPADPNLDDFINRVESIRDPTHVRSHTIDQWYDWLTEAGITIDETVNLKKTLKFDDWVENQSVTPSARDQVETVLRNAESDASDVFEIKTVGDSVKSFANLKVLVRGTLAK